MSQVFQLYTPVPLRIFGDVVVGAAVGMVGGIMLSSDSDNANTMKKTIVVGIVATLLVDYLWGDATTVRLVASN